MDITGKNKVAVLFSLLGPEISANIISKLSLEDANVVRNEILIDIDNVEKPDNLDAFIEDLLISPQETIDSQEVFKEESIPVAVIIKKGVIG